MCWTLGTPCCMLHSQSHTLLGPFEFYVLMFPTHAHLVPPPTHPPTIQPPGRPPTLPSSTRNGKQHENHRATTSTSEYLKVVAFKTHRQLHNESAPKRCHRDQQEAQSTFSTRADQKSINLMLLSLAVTNSSGGEEGERGKRGRKEGERRERGGREEEERRERVEREEEERKERGGRDGEERRKRGGGEEEARKGRGRGEQERRGGGRKEHERRERGGGRGGEEKKEGGVCCFCRRRSFLPAALKVHDRSTVVLSSRDWASRDAVALLRAFTQ